MTRDDQHDQITSRLTHFKDVKENIFKVSWLRLWLYIVNRPTFRKMMKVLILIGITTYSVTTNSVTKKRFVGNRKKKTVRALRGKQFDTQWQQAIMRIYTNSKSE